MDFFENIKNWNLDIAIGACVNSYFFSAILNIKIPLETYFLLFNSVWIIYTLDRIFDASFSKFRSTVRHQFHYFYRNRLLLIATLLIVINLFLLFRINQSLIFNGLILGGGVLIYLSFVVLTKGNFVKEPWIALFYSAGVSIAPYSYATQTIPDSAFTLALFIHFLIAFCNLSIFSFYESEYSEKKGQFNMLLNWSLKKKKLILSALLLATSFSCFVSIWLFPQQIIYWSILAVMTLWLTFVYKTPGYFSRNNKYRFWADFTFLIPAVLIYFE